MRTVVAMSGGVDSSVAAALLVERGHDVVGLSMQLYDQRDPGHTWGSCCTLDDLRDAARVATRIGIPHYIVNLEDKFRDVVVSDFVRQYASGRTPLPCAHCNSELKFSTLLDKARGLDAAHLATGHYVRVTRRPEDGRWLLQRGRDVEKDQSYFLFGLTQAQLAEALFPVGALTKTEVRAHAQRFGLPVAEKPDSQEICFIPDHDYAHFVESRIVPRAGDIVDERGVTLGTHEGVHRFTVGQRKGLGVSGQAPMYVLRIDAASHQVTVGPRTALERTLVTASSVNWISTAPPVRPLRVEAQIRHRHAAAPAWVFARDGGQAEVHFDGPQLAITPGQAIVFYDGDVVVGGGWID